LHALVLFRRCNRVPVYATTATGTYMAGNGVIRIVDGKRLLAEVSESYLKQVEILRCF